MKFPVRPRTLKDLQDMSEPQAVQGGQSEAVPWELFNVQTYLSAATTNLLFYTAAPASPRLGNVGGAGLPSPQFFESYYICLDPKLPPVAAAGTPILDMWSLLNGNPAAQAGDPTWTFVLADKKLGPFPLRSLHTRGGAIGFTSQATSEYSNNSDTTGQGTFCFDGAIVIPPTQAFSVELVWPGPVTLDAGDTELTIDMPGVLHRRVL